MSLFYWAQPGARWWEGAQEKDSSSLPHRPYSCQQTNNLPGYSKCFSRSCPRSFPTTSYGSQIPLVETTGIWLALIQTRKASHIAGAEAAGASHGVHKTAGALVCLSEETGCFVFIPGLFSQSEYLVWPYYSNSSFLPSSSTLIPKRTMELDLECSNNAMEGLGVQDTWAKVLAH